MQNPTPPAPISDRYVRAMEFRVLGPLEAVAKGSRLALGGPKQRSVLALLLARTGERVSMGNLIEGAYGEDAPDRAHRSVHTFISNLRGELGEVIARDGDGYVLDIGRDSVDALRFEDLVADAATADDPADSGEALRTALGLWRGHPYADVDGHTLLEAEVTRLGELRVAAIEARVEADLNTGLDRELIAELESLTGEYPLHERFRAQQMVALYRAGRQGEALRAFEKTRTYLVEEMGLDPSLELRALESRILDQDESLLLSRRPTVQTAAVLVADIADSETLADLTPGGRLQLISTQAAAIDREVTVAKGKVFAQRGTAVYARFDAPAHAARAALRIGSSLGGSTAQPRIAITAGELDVSVNGEVSGPPLSRAAALVSVAHTGQVLLSAEANEAIGASGVADLVVRSLGEHRIDGLAAGELVYQLGGDGLPDRYPPLRTDEVPVALPVVDHALPGYELREQVGAGAFGVVHRAYQPSMGREVAVKIIQPELANDAEFVRRFEVEAQLVARLEHPHIVPLYDYWRSPEGAFLVMRWLRGGSLADRLAQGALSLAEVDAMVSQLGMALDYAHRNRVAHRDIKPTNVVFDDDGNAYLADFGVAQPAVPVGDLVERDVRDLARLIDLCLDDRESVHEFLETATSDSGFSTVAELLGAWHEVVGEGARQPEISFTPSRNPYKGLRSFTELDADDFYGRDGEVTQLVAAVAASRVVAVVGPSGVGKSSVVRAGLLPALRSGAVAGSGDWLFASMTPGTYPLEELTNALSRVATEGSVDIEGELRREERGLVRAAKRAMPVGSTVLLLIDQFEELFTLSTPSERDSLLHLIQAAVADPRSPLRIVLTMRADFFDRPLGVGDFGDLLGEAIVPIAAPSVEALREMVVAPAASVGVSFEAGLVDSIVADVKDQPGALPLLEFGLSELFEGRTADVISLSTYVESGGVRSALGRRAEGVYAALDATGKQSVREVFLRLVNVSNSGHVTRRRVRRRELDRLGVDPSTVSEVLAALNGSRLLTFDRDVATRMPTVEVAHEALLLEWPRLAGWIEERRLDLVLRGRLAAAVDDWEQADRSDEYLLKGGQLVQHETWTGGTDLSLTSAERELIAESRAATDHHRQVRARNRRAVLAGFGVAALVALTLAVLAFVAKSNADEQRALAESEAVRAQQNEEAAIAASQLAAENEATAERERELALEQSALAERRRLLANATAVLDEDPQLSLLLALAGMDDDGTLAADLTMLREIVAANRVLATHVWDDGSVVETRGDLSPDGQRLVIGANPGNHVAMVDAVSGEQVWVFPVGAEAGLTHTDARFVTGGTEVLVNVGSSVESTGDVPQQVGVYVLNADSGAVLRRFEISSCGAELSRSDDSASSALFLTVSEPRIAESGCGPTNAGFVHRDVVVMDLLDGSTRTVVSDFADFWGDPPVALSADGATIATHLPFEDVIVYDTATGIPIAQIPHGASSAVALSPDGTMVVFGGIGANFGRVLYVHDIATGARLSTIAAHPGGTGGATFTGDSATIMTAGSDGAVRVWTPGDGELVGEVLAGASAKNAIALSDDGRRLGIFGAGAEAFVASVDGAELGAPDLCWGPSAFYQSFGLRVRGDRASVYVACGFDDARGRAVDLITGSIIGESQQTSGFGVDLSPDGRSIASQEYWSIGTGSSTEYWFGTVTVEDLVSGEVVEMKGLCDFNSMDPDPDGCAAAPELPLAIANTELKFSADGTLLAAVEDRVKVGLVWDVASGDPVHVFQGTDFAFSADSGSFLMVSGDRLVLRDTSEFNVIAERALDIADSDLANLEFTPDGKYIVGSPFASAGRSDVSVLHAETLEEVLRIPSPHAGGIRDLAVSTDGTMLATAGTDGYVGVWDLTNGEPLMSIPVAPESRVQVVAFFDGDRQLLAGTVTGPIYRYSLDREEVVAGARSRVIRGFTAAECSTYFPDGGCPTLAEISNTP